MQVQRVDQEFQCYGFPHIIMVQECHKLGTWRCLLETSVACRRDSVVASSHHANALVVSRQLFGKRDRGIARSVVKQHELPDRQRLRANALYGGGSVCYCAI